MGIRAGSVLVSWRRFFWIDAEVAYYVLLTPRRSSWLSTLRVPTVSAGPALRGGGWVVCPIASPFVPVRPGVLVPELWTARENAHLEIGSQRGRNSHQVGVLGIYGL